MMFFYHIADYFFLLFHTALMIFNLFGWIPAKWRKWNLLTLLITAASWFLLGIFYGMGYCFLTDWHWTILAKLGKSPGVNSYVQYLFHRLLHIDISADFADMLTVLLFFLALIISLILNIRDFWRKRKGAS